MRFEFLESPTACIAATNGSSRPVAAVEIVLDEPPFAGLRLVGWSVWADSQEAVGPFVGPPNSLLEQKSHDRGPGTDSSGIARDLKLAILKAFAETGPELGRIRADVSDQVWFGSGESPD